MKRLLILVTAILLITSCKNGIYFGKRFPTANSISQDSLYTLLTTDTLIKGVKVNGIVDFVCQQEGCWFTYLTSDGEIIRVMLKNKAYVIPNEINLKSAICLGDGRRKVFPPEELKRIYQQAGYPPKTWDTIENAQVHYILEAESIFLY